MTLDELRSQIDALDEQIVNLLNERARHAVEIGKIKHAGNTRCYVPEREQKVYERVKALTQGPLSPDAIHDIYREVISATRALERPIDVAFLGPPQTFSHMAALSIFGAGSTYHPMATIDDVFMAVERSRVSYGVVPAETSMGGGVIDTMDRFAASELKIVNEILLRIHLDLLANCALEEVERVYSKAQPFVQCRNWLKVNLPNAECVETPSTAEAARIAAQEDKTAAIASRLAAETYGLAIVANDIEDASHNYTRFFVVGHDMLEPTGNDKTAILCAIKDRPGALYALLTPLADAGINLTRIESRPSRKRAWEYVFFIDIVGHAKEPRIRDALEQVSTHCKELRILGSFPRGQVEG